MDNRAWLCRLQDTASDGKLISFSLFAWGEPNSATLRWEFQRILPPVGYLEKGAGSRVCDRWRKHIDKGAAYLRVYGMDPDLHRARSYHAGRQPRNARPSDGQIAEQEYWISTPCLSLFLFWQSHRKQPFIDITLNAFRAYFHKVLDPGFVSRLSLDEASAAHLQLCVVRDGVGPCACVSSVLEKFDANANGTPQATLIRFMIALFAQQQCFTCNAWLKHILERTSAHLESRTDSWGITDLLK